MHSHHTTTTTQEELDMLANKSSPYPPTIKLTAAAHPTWKNSAKPDAPLADAPTTALAATEEWRIPMGKAAQWKAKVTEANKKRMEKLCGETPNNENGG
jgi:hypothetical protein